MRKPVLAAVLLLASAIPLAAQMTVNVHLVEVPVTVIGRDGNPVRGLTAKNFQLFDDGQPQKISSFEAIDFAAQKSVTALSPLNASARRTFLLLFDLGYSDAKMLARARDAARRFVSANVQPRDLVAVGVIEPEKGFHFLTAFTTDRTVVSNAIADPLHHHGSDPLQLSEVDAFGQRGDGTTVESVFGAQSSGGGRSDEASATLAEIRQLTSQNNRSYTADRINKQLDSLGALASTLRAVPGRKQVVLLSAGFDATVLCGRTARGSINAEVRDLGLATSGQAYRIDNDARFGNSSSQNVVGQMVKLFKQSDVVMNAIDILGVRADDALGGTTSQSNDALHLLADPTGGTVFEGTNDLRTNFEKMMRQQEVVYVLAFQAPSSKPGKMHDLTVKLVDAPAAAAVHHRLSYFEGGGTENNVERALTNAQIIVNDIPQNDVHLAVLAAAIPGLPRAAVPLFVEISGDDLLRGAAKPVPTDIFVYAFDEQGIVRDRLYQHLEIDPAKAADKVKNGLKYFATLSLPPGRYAVKSLVALPESQKRGFSRTDLVVPAATDLSVLPPLFLDKPGQWGMLKGVQHDTSAYPFHLDGQTFVPSAMPRLRATDKGEFALFLYNAKPEEMMMQATVTDAAGVTRPAAASLVRQLRSEGVAKLVFQYDPAGLASGPATLDLLIHKKGSPEVRRASVPLVVGN